MIDIENDINDIIKPIILASYPSANIIGNSLENDPDTFPTISLYEADNYPVVDTQDSSSNENHVHVMYEVAIYTNKPDSKKSQAKSILKIIDEEFNKLGFTRTMKNPISRGNASIFELLTRYEAKVGKDKTIYRR